MPKALENKLIEKFKDKEAFSRKELLDFYVQYEPNLNEGTFGWRIHDLKQKDIIKTIARGLYSISFKPRYRPDVSQELVKIGKKVAAKFEGVRFCIWDTSWLNELLQHQSNKLIIILEIEKDFGESLYYEIKDSYNYDVYLNPHEREIDLYVAESNKPVVIKNLITRSPLSSKVEKKFRIPIPQLEKILVDLFADDKLFFYVQGSEMIHIYENALTKYSINYTKLFSYAKRRGIDQEIKKFLSSKLLHLVKDIIDD